MKNSITAFILSLLISSSTAADNWPQWRGPTYDGIAVGEKYPLNWSSTENIAWKVKLPGAGSSTPAVWEDRIFVTSPDQGKDSILCYNRDGDELWRKTFGKERPGKNNKASGSNPSPTTDGRYVYVYYKSGDLICLNFAGDVVWQKNLQELYGEDTLWWDLGTSPVLTKNLVVVACMHSGPSYLAGFDKATGEVAWKVDRNLGAPVEAAQSYSTPVVLSKDGKETLIVLGADHVTAHDAADGQEIWRVGGLNPTKHKYFRSISSPVVSSGLVIAPYARGDSLTAIRLGGTGDITKSHIAWKKSNASADVPTPTVLDGKIYVCRDKGEVVCFDLKSGEKLWGERVAKHRRTFSSSPILAGGHVYVTREDGTTFVLKQGDEFKLVATNTLNEQTVATPVCVDGKILLRTSENLYCIGR